MLDVRERSLSAERVSEALLDLVTDVAGYHTLADLLRSLSARLQELIPFDQLAVIVYDADTGCMRLALQEPPDSLMFPPLEFPPTRIPVDFGPSGWVWRSQATQHFSLAAEQSHFTLHHLRDAGYRSVCFVPLTTSRARLGTLGFASKLIDTYPGESMAFMERIAHLLALAIEHAKHVERLATLSRAVTEERDRARLLLDVTNALASERDLTDLLRAISQLLRDTVRHQYASVTLWDEEARQLRRHALVFPTSRGVLKEGELLASQNTPPRLAFDRGETMVFQWADVEALDEYSADVMAAEGLRSVCCVPLPTARRRHGTLNVARPDDAGFREEDVRLLEQIARQLAVMIENALAFTEISDLKDRLHEERLYLEDEIARQQDFKEIIGNSRALTSVLDQIRTVAPTDATVLLLGETGTGKELLARALHDLSRRRERTFVRVNGAALPAGLVESELFGYEKGAFTGAIAARAGRLEVAHRGTLFLDEVGDIPLEVQPKLLRAIQEREFERLGSTRTHRVDVRLVAATNRNLEEMVADGSFRADLYYRLSVFPIRVPALRDRPEDIPPLVHHFVGRFASEMGREISTIPRMVMEGLVKWDWPGNIRELENVIERAVILSRGTTLEMSPASFQPVSVPKGARTVEPGEVLRDYGSMERDAILRALRESHGVVGGPGGAAVRLGLKRTTLHSKMRKFGIARPSY